MLPRKSSVVLILVDLDARQRPRTSGSLTPHYTNRLRALSNAPALRASSSRPPPIRLARRPFHLPTPQQVKMHVIHRLAGGGAAVGHEPVAALGDALASRDLSRNSHKMPEANVVLSYKIVQR